MTRTCHPRANAAPRSARAFMLSAAVAIAALLAAGCSPSLVITVNPDSSGRASFACEASQTADSVIRRFTSSDSSTERDKPLFDKKAITVSLAHAGLKVESLELPSKSALTMGVSFLRLEGVIGKAVTLDKDGRRITVKLTRDILKDSLEVMPSSTKEYTDLLMAPVFTGESMSAPEYEDTVAAAYGKKLAADLRKSVFTIAIRCPGEVAKFAATAPATATATGQTVTVCVPLSALLSMNQPITAFAEW